MSNIDELIEWLRDCAGTPGAVKMCMAAADALEELQAENEKLRAEAEGMRSNWYKAVEEVKNLRAELEQMKKLYESEREGFIDFACSGVPNLSIYCMNRHPDCVDERGWCRTEKCRGFSRERGPKEY